MGECAALAEIGNLANTIGTTVFDGGRVQCNEIEIEDSKQLCNVLRHANNEGVFVFRGAVDERPAKLAKLFPASEKHVQAVFLNLSKMNRIIEHVKGDQVVSVETGIKVGELNEYLSKHGQWLPVEFSSATVSLADILDTADGGYLEPFSGGVKHLVLGMELGIAHGELIKTGGKIVKNVTGYDLSKVFTGSRSWLAVPHMVHLRLHSKPETEVAFVVSSEKPHELVGLANRLQATGLPAFSLELIDKRLLQRIANRAGGSAAGPASIQDDIAAFGSATGDLEGKLIVSTRGHHDVCREVARALQEAVLQSNLELEAVEVESALLNRIQRICSDVFKAHEDHVELSIPASTISYYFETQWRSSKRLWSARPSSGRLRLAVDDAESFISDLSNFANLINVDDAQPLTVAFANSSHEFVTQRIPADHESDSGLRNVIDRLKSKYDPNRILNPLVSFC